MDRQVGYLVEEALIEALAECRAVSLLGFDNNDGVWKITRRVDGKYGSYWTTY